MIVGRGGQGLDELRKALSKQTGRQDIRLDVIEVARVDADAQLLSESIAQQLEKRVAFRRVLKQTIQRAMRSGIKGIKVMVSGRLGGTEIARCEWLKEGRIPLHTFRADIDYGFSEAMTMFGIIGVKVWVFKGEVLPGEKATANIKARSGPGGPGGGPDKQGLHGAGRGGARRPSDGPDAAGRGRRGKRGAPNAPAGSPPPQASAQPKPAKAAPKLNAAPKVISTGESAATPAKSETAPDSNKPSTEES